MVFSSLSGTLSKLTFLFIVPHTLPKHHQSASLQHTTLNNYNQSDSEKKAKKTKDYLQTCNVVEKLSEH